MATVVLKGVRVVRGPDWSWGEQDGGEGHVGTVTSIVGGSGTGCPQWAIVQWDVADRRYKYRCGAEGKYDLRLFDSGPAGMKHPGSVCSSCLVEDIAGTLWRCVNCINYCLCAGCYSGGKHCIRHTFIRVDIGGNKQSGVHVPVRLNAEVVTAQGIFTGAEVVRGYNWKWADQDGHAGNSGTVLKVVGWKDESLRSVVLVQWSHTEKRNIYRVGHRGKVDVKCINSASGGCYYPQHLLPLGASCHRELTDQIFKAGDLVTTELDYEVFRTMQEGHGDWIEHKALAIGRVGQIFCIDSLGDLFVKLCGVGTVWLNPASMIQTQLHQFSAGDRVRVIADRMKVMELQADHGEWSDALTMVLGHVGMVVRVLTHDCVDVLVGGYFWTFNSLCLSTVNDSEPEMHSSSSLQTLPSQSVPVAALLGDTVKLKSVLEENPNQINAELNHNTALHFAVAQGNIEMLKILLQFKPDVEAKMIVENTPLHIAAASCHPDAAQLLLDAGAKLNARGKLGVTATIVAARLGRHRVLNTLLKHSNVDINLQDFNGNTALHAAMHGQKSECIALLLDAGADPTLLNNSGVSPISHASKMGLYQCLEYITIYCPQHLKMRDDEGLTPLHDATNMGFFNVLCLLLESRVCDIDAATAKFGKTTLHVASHWERPRGLEMLITHGANPNVQDSIGNTPLLIVLQNKVMVEPTDDSPLTKKIYEDLIAAYGSDKIEPYIASACLLMQYGADIHIKDKVGTSPLKVVPPDVVNILMSHQPVSSVATPLSQNATDLKPEIDSPQTVDVNEVAMPTDSESTDSAAKVLCFLCEESQADIRFEPCGDIVMCSTCAAATKKCPKCRCYIKAKEKVS